MVNIPFSQLSIAVTLLNSASEQIIDAAHYLERAGDEPCSRELYALERQTQSLIVKIETRLRQDGATAKRKGASC